MESNDKELRKAQKDPSLRFGMTISRQSGILYFPWRSWQLIGRWGHLYQGLSDRLCHRVDPPPPTGEDQLCPGPPVPRRRRPRL